MLNFLQSNLNFMDAKPVSFSKTTITELMVPSMANFSGKVHGGTLLSLMDKAAYAASAKHSGRYCVTVAVEGVEFREPVEVGELVSLYASVNYVGNSSMIVGIRVESMKPRTGEVKHTNTCYFTMVAKDEEGNLVHVPELILENHDDVRRFIEGKKLKAMRSNVHAITHNEMSEEQYTFEMDMLSSDRCIINTDE